MTFTTLFLRYILDSSYRNICSCLLSYIHLNNSFQNWHRPHFLVPAASINETCMFNEQCEDVYFKTECRNERCACKFEMVPEVMVDGAVICTCEFWQIMFCLFVECIMSFEVESIFYTWNVCLVKMFNIFLWK